MSYFRMPPFSEDYISIDFARDLDTGETINTASWALEAPLTSILQQNEPTRVTMFLRTDTEGQVSRAVCTVTTSLGRVLIRTEFVECSP